MRDSGISQRKIFVELNGLLEHLQRVIGIFAPRIAAAPQIEIISLGVFRGLNADDFFFLRSESDAQRMRDASSNFVLADESDFPLAVVALSPHRMPRRAFHQLRGDSQAVSGAANGAFKNEGGAKL